MPRRARSIAVIVATVLVASCSAASPAASPIPTVTGTCCVPPSATPRRSATPPPTPDLHLPPVTLMATAGAKAFTITPSPDFAVIAGGDLFVVGAGDGIARIDATGGQIATWTIPGDTCAAMDVGFGAVWSATCAAPGLVRIDVTTNSLKAIDIGAVLPDSEASIGVGEGGVWMISGLIERSLTKVDPKSLKVAARYTLELQPTAVRVGFGGVWVSYPANDLVRRFDPATGKQLAEIKVGAKPQFFAVGEGGVWTMNQADGTVSHIDPATNTVVATIPLGEPVEGGDIAAGGGFVWLRGNPTLLFKIDPKTNQIVARYGPNFGSGSVAADDAAVWVTAHDVQTVWRLSLR